MSCAVAILQSFSGKAHVATLADTLRADLAGIASEFCARRGVCAGHEEPWYVDALFTAGASPVQNSELSTAHGPASPSSVVRGTSELALSTLAALSLADLNMLLFNFLIATTAKDASIFLSLTTTASTSDGIGESTRITVTAVPDSHRAFATQATEISGAIGDRDELISSDAQSRQFAKEGASISAAIAPATTVECVAVIDLDAKPPSKLHKWFQLDESVSQMFFNHRDRDRTATAASLNGSA